MASDSRGAAPLRVLALSHNDGAEVCTLARLVTPLDALRAAGLVDDTLRKVHLYQLPGLPSLLRDLPHWDIVWVLRPHHYVMLPLIHEARRLGKPVLVDIDDWLLDLPADHSDRGFFMNRPTQETIRLALRMATAVTTSTRVLARQCAALGLRTHVVPNTVDCARYTRFPRNEGVTTIGFCGSISHRPDVPLIAPGLRKLLQAHPDSVRVVSMGCPLPELEDLPGYTHHEPVVATAYAEALSGLRLDVGLAPLRDTPFNRAKSDIKYLEYSATGATTIAARVESYDESVQDDRGVLVANTPEAWSDAMERLVADAQRRQRLAAAAYAWVRSERSNEAAADENNALLRAYSSGATTDRGHAYRSTDVERYVHTMVDIVARQLPADARRVSAGLAQQASVALSNVVRRGARETYIG